MIQSIKVKKCFLLAIIVIIIIIILITLILIILLIKNILVDTKPTKYEIKHKSIEGMIDERKLTEMELNFKRELQSDPTEIIDRMTELDLSYGSREINFPEFFDILL